MVISLLRGGCLGVLCGIRGAVLIAEHLVVGVLVLRGRLEGRVLVHLGDERVLVGDGHRADGFQAVLQGGVDFGLVGDCLQSSNGGIRCLLSSFLGGFLISRLRAGCLVDLSGLLFQFSLNLGESRSDVDQFVFRRLELFAQLLVIRSSLDFLGRYSRLSGSDSLIQLGNRRVGLINNRGFLDLLERLKLFAQQLLRGRISLLIHVEGLENRGDVVLHRALQSQGFRMVPVLENPAGRCEVRSDLNLVVRDARGKINGLGSKVPHSA